MLLMALRQTSLSVACGLSAQQYFMHYSAQTKQFIYLLSSLLDSHFSLFKGYWSSLSIHHVGLCVHFEYFQFLVSCGLCRLFCIIIIESPNRTKSSTLFNSVECCLFKQYGAPEAGTS